MNEEKERIKNQMIKVWDNVAPNFGNIGPRYWDFFGRRLVELASINEGAQVLDIGTGRGASLFPSIAKVGLHGHVTGIDISEGMVQETKADIHNQGIKNAIIMQMDANKLTFNHASFDNILCGFALGALTQEDNKLSEVLRVLKSDGQIGLSIWGVQEDNKWLVGLGNKHLKLSPPTENKKSNFNDPTFDVCKWITTILTEAGFKDIHTYAETSDVIYKDEEEWWNEMWSNAVRYTLDELTNMGNDALQGFKSEALEGVVKYKTDNGICFKRAVIYAFGRK
ncbi:class I SAM-dependent methyltransferase [Clostridium sp. CS001]|uniref:class I SAM-dependent methyltransferase n=1 Tax=Clostridium sp. CS001 TaxID=2880648 RepID=UPI001CF46868|nr:class I SAM-dependent methyltransferase [Clostridium sp. CS001]MCB2291737.1 class I SAM-dependent methyltransferase [Clostridium sp. CS001]